MPKLSVVAPAYNEEEVLEEFVSRVRQALELSGYEFELIVVDDGSSDGTFERLRQLRQHDRRVKAVRLSRNFGQELAVQAGLDAADGDAIILIDADLQDPPELILQLIDHWRAGSRVVVGQRLARAEPWARRLATRLFHWLFRRITPFGEQGDIGLFCLLDRQVAELLRAMPERHRYLRGLRAYVGFRPALVTYERAGRQGAARQSLSKLIRLAADALFSFSYLPLRISLFAGLIISAFCLFYAAVLFVLGLLGLLFPESYFGALRERGFTTTAVAILFLGGVQLVAIGIIGEYLGRIYEEVKRRPNYVVAETLGIERAKWAASAKEPQANEQ